MHARWILGLCERFGCLPSQLLDEDADLMRLLTIEYLAAPDPGPEPEADLEEW